MKFLLIISMFFISSFTLAAQEQDFDTFITDFYQKFSQRQLKTVSEQYFDKNAQFVFGEHIMVPGSSIEIEAVFKSIIGSLEKDDYQKSVIRNISKNYASNNYVVATILFDRIKTNSEKLDSMCSTYSAIQVAGQWKILTWLPSKPQQDDSCF